MRPSRLRPDLPFPPYAYVPGRFPHPTRHPHGHGGVSPAVGDPRDPARSPAFCYGLDLFNHGYYWEAHEAFEALWDALGRKAPEAVLVAGLISLAACGVKAREGREAGVRRHAERARARLERARAALGQRALGLDLDALIAAASALAEDPPLCPAAPGAGPEVVLPLRLEPGLTKR